MGLDNNEIEEPYQAVLLLFPVLHGGIADAICLGTLTSAVKLNVV